MQRHLAVGAVFIATALLLGCAQTPPEDPAEAAFTTLREQFMTAEGPRDKVAIAEKYLAEFPDGERSPSVLDAAVYYLSEELEERQRARALAEQTLARVQDPERRFEMGMTLWRVQHALGETGDLAALADALAAHRPLRYRELANLSEAAVDSGSWDLAERYSNAALALATPEAYRAEYPDREFDDEMVQRRVGSRRANSLANRGWARFQQQRVDEAMADFEEGSGHSTTNYAGIPYTPINTYWGLAAVEQGDFERAEELLAADAVMGGSERAMAGLRRAFVARTGSEDGIDDYLRARRDALARTIDDFTLPTYDAEEVSMSSLSGRVVLLAFWFPT
jgi:hypothetical protein